jgi:hypothetical protein
MAEGYVYFIRCRGTGLVKIGYSGDHPRVRLRRLRATCPTALEPLGLMRGGLDLERRLHARFDPDWSHGEWFSGAEGLLAMIAAEADSWEDEPRKFVRRPPVREVGSYLLGGHIPRRMP